MKRKPNTVGYSAVQVAEWQRGVYVPAKKKGKENKGRTHYPKSGRWVYDTLYYPSGIVPQWRISATPRWLMNGDRLIVYARYFDSRGHLAFNAVAPHLGANRSMYSVVRLLDSKDDQPTYVKTLWDTYEHIPRQVERLVMTSSRLRELYFKRAPELARQRRPLRFNK